MRVIRRRLQQEEGFVLVVALLLVVTILLLAAAIIATSVATSSHATSEYGRSGAIAAANAGLEAAVHRLSSQAEETTAQQEDCFTTKFEAKEGGVCPGTSWETLGSGAEYKYYVSPVMTANECAGLWIKAPAGKTLTQRCITAIGKANGGGTARVQERVANVLGPGIFPVAGIYAETNFKVNNKLNYSGEIGARGNVEFNNGVKNVGKEITIKYGGEYKSHEGGLTHETLSKEELESERFKLPTQPATGYANSQTTNNNAAITMTVGSVNAGREMSAATNTTVTIPSGTYNLCYIDFTNAAKILYTPPVTIYLDDYHRSGSTCASKSTSGTIELNNAVEWLDQASTKSPADLKINAWGNPPETSNSAPKIHLNNAVSGPMYAMIYAPNSYFEVNNSFSMVGGLVAGSIYFNNEVTFVGELPASEAGTGGLSFFPTAYHQCSPSTSPTAAGCY